MSLSDAPTLQAPKTLPQLGKFLYGKKVELNTKLEEALLRDDLQDAQQKITLGKVFKRKWTTSPLIADKLFDFRYDRTEIGRDCVERFVEFIHTDSKYKVFINYGLPGGGKSHLFYQVAVRDQAYIILYDCARNAQIIGRIIDEYHQKHKTEKSSLSYFHKFSEKLTSDIWCFSLANAIALLHLVEGHRLKPDMFLRYLESGGSSHVEEIFLNLREVFDANSASSMLQRVMSRISQLTSRPILHVWDNADYLNQWAHGQVPFAYHPNNPLTKWNESQGVLENGGSAYLIAMRIACTSVGRTMFCGSSMELSFVEGDISESLAGRIRKTPEYPFKMRNWGPTTVVASLEEDLAIRPFQDMNNIGHILQGRPNFTHQFKEVFFKYMKEIPDGSVTDNLKSALLASEKIILDKLLYYIDSYVKDGEDRLIILKKLAVKGSFTASLPNKEIKNQFDTIDLASHGIMQLDSLENETVRYSRLEPLMLWAIYYYLEKKGIDFVDILLDWIGNIDEDLKLISEEIKCNSKKLTTDDLLAHVLVCVSKELNGRPITNHPLFRDSQGTFLDNYTMEFKEHAYDNQGLKWQQMLKERNRDILLLPPETMGPDLIGLLKCIPDSLAHKLKGDHCIPLLASCKSFSKISSSGQLNLLSNAHSEAVRKMDLSNAFTEKGEILDVKSRKVLDQMLPQALSWETVEFISRFSAEALEQLKKYDEIATAEYQARRREKEEALADAEALGVDDIYQHAYQKLREAALARRAQKSAAQNNIASFEQNLDMKEQNANPPPVIAQEDSPKPSGDSSQETPVQEEASPRTTEDILKKEEYEAGVWVVGGQRIPWDPPKAYRTIIRQREKRHLSISFTYNPFIKPILQPITHAKLPYETVHLVFDFHNKEFEDCIRRHVKDTKSFLSKFVTK